MIERRALGCHVSVAEAEYFRYLILTFFFFSGAAVAIVSMLRLVCEDVAVLGSYA